VLEADVDQIHVFARTRTPTRELELPAPGAVVDATQVGVSGTPRDGRCVELGEHVIDVEFEATG
jgi:hypothetical protein